MKKSVGLSRALGLLLLLCWCACGNPFGAPPLVGIILWNQEIQSYEDNLQGVVEGLREEGFQDGLNLRLRVVNVTGDRSRAAAAVHEFLMERASLLITLGTVPTLVALEITRDTPLPVVYAGVAVPPVTTTEHLPSSKTQRVRVTGISLEVPVAEQLHYFRAARPELQKLGILYCTATPEAEATGRAAEVAARDLGLTPIPYTIPDGRPELLAQALQWLLEQDVQGLYVPTDSVLLAPSRFQVIAAQTQKAGVPVMAPFPSAVGLGALLSYHADMAEMGRQAGRLAARRLRGEELPADKPQGPLVKRLVLNAAVAQKLGLPLSRYLLSRAHELY